MTTGHFAISCEHARPGEGPCAQCSPPRSEVRCQCGRLIVLRPFPEVVAEMQRIEQGKTMIVKWLEPHERIIP